MSDDPVNGELLPAKEAEADVEAQADMEAGLDTAGVRDPDEILSPPPFRDPADFAPIPPPKASVEDILELIGHIGFVLVVTVLVPLGVIWAVYRLYRWLPFETIAFVIAGLASLWAYRDRLGALLRRVLLGKAKRGEG